MPTQAYGQLDPCDRQARIMASTTAGCTASFTPPVMGIQCPQLTMQTTLKLLACRPPMAGSKLTFGLQLGSLAGRCKCNRQRVTAAADWWWQLGLLQLRGCSRAENAISAGIVRICSKYILLQSYNDSSSKGDHCLPEACGNGSSCNTGAYLLAEYG
jgi:hypothetical protein